ncbi:STAS domain-containing protein [Streptomyces sp. NPDC016845]|uniref:STAS domain-containing protein n=1 Tax=Streptomyces sp. NPDC016845 TaxID=3364972 RepID=UPI0037B8E83F
MQNFFVDDRCLITPLQREEGVRLFGEVVGAHQVPLATAVAECAQRAQEITVDLTAVDYLSNSALATLVGLARTLRPPQALVIVSQPALRLDLRLQERGWDGLDTLYLRCT